MIAHMSSANRFPAKSRDNRGFNMPSSNTPHLPTEPKTLNPAHRGEPPRSEAELAINIKKATSNDETAPKRKHVRSCIVYTWDHKSSQSFWAGMKVYVGEGELVDRGSLLTAATYEQAAYSRR